MMIAFNAAEGRKTKLSNWVKNELWEHIFLMVTIIQFKQKIDQGGKEASGSLKIEFSEDLAEFVALQKYFI